MRYAVQLLISGHWHTVARARRALRAAGYSDRLYWAGHTVRVRRV